MQHPIVALLRALLLIVLTAAALAGAGNTLDIYFIDTEGGQATLLVSPSGETLMIDVGFAGLDTPNPDKEHYLKVSATEDGAFTVFNSRTNETKRYAARR